MTKTPDETDRTEEDRLAGTCSGVSHPGICEATGLGKGDVLILAAVALVARLVYLAETADVVFIGNLVGDAKGYYDWALRIYGGEWVGSEPFYQAPLYPYVLATWMKIVGDSVAGIRVLQSLWGVAGCVFLGLTAGRMFNRQAGIVAGVMLAVYPSAIFFDGIVQKASLGCFLLCLLLFVMSRFAAGRRAGCAVAVGAVAGLLALTRENALIWVAVLLPWVWWVSRQNGEPDTPLEDPGDPAESAPTDGGDATTPQRDELSGYRSAGWWMACWYLAGALCVLGPVAVRNAVVGGSLSPTTFQAGPNFYIGNSADADGRYRPLVRGHETPAFERRDATRLAERDTGRHLSSQEVSNYWFARAWRDIKGDPARWVRLMLTKIAMVMNRYEVSDVESQYVYAEFSGLLRGLGVAWHFGILCPLAAVGILMTRHLRCRLWIHYVLIVTMIAGVALFFVLARYRFPLVPLLIPLAAAGSVELFNRVKTRAWSGVLVTVIVGCVVGIATNWPVHDQRRLDALAHMNLGIALASADGNRLEEATKYFRLAVEGNPTSVEAHFNLGQALALKGDDGGAIAEYEAALSLEPNLANVDFYLARALERSGNLEKALKHYRRAIELAPDDQEARQAIDRIE